MVDILSIIRQLQAPLSVRRDGKDNQRAGGPTFNNPFCTAEDDGAQKKRRINPDSNNWVVQPQNKSPAKSWRTRTYRRAHNLLIKDVEFPTARVML